MSTEKIPFDGPLFVIDGGSPDKIPTFEIDTYSGTRGVLIFTSKKKAHRFCWVRSPDAVESIYELTRTHREDGLVIQSSLIRMCRLLKTNYTDLTHFIIDHPGTKGKISQVLVDDLLGYVSYQKSTEEAPADDFASVFDAASQD